jgi:hypothetical protein
MHKKVSWILVLALLLVSVTAVMADYPVSTQGVVPDYWDTGPGGNVECSDLNFEYQISSDRFDEGDQLGGTFETITWETDETGTYVSWAGEHGGMAIILKGGNAAHVYTYTLDPYYNWDSQLASPLNEGGQIPALSNITFCYNPPEEELCFEDETAWAYGPRYSEERGNWATYTPYQSDEPVDIFAGQDIWVGTVSFSEVVDGKVTITIDLVGATLQAGEDEPVKIQGYAEAPSGNPSPGTFTTYKGQDLVVEVDAFAFYGIHLDVSVEVPCPVE